MSPFTRFDNWLHALLRGRADEENAFSPRALALCVLFCGAFYGAAMGAYGGFGGKLSLWQMLFSACKVPALLLVNFALCVPGFFVMNALFGLGDDFAAARRALLLSQAALAVVLAALCPFVLLFYASSSHYPAAILCNGLLFGAASFAAQHRLRRLYAPLINRNARHAAMLRLWLALFIFTGVQLAYTLRPFVGDPAQPASLFRPGAIQNAYVVIGRMIFSF